MERRPYVSRIIDDTFGRVFALRGIAMLVAGCVGIIVSILDAVDDGFSVWNGISIACFVVVLLYGLRDLTNRTT